MDTLAKGAYTWQEQAIIISYLVYSSLVTFYSYIMYYPKTRPVGTGGYYNSTSQNYTSQLEIAVTIDML